MAPHSSIHAWRIPWTEERGRLQSMGSQRVRHDLVTKPPPWCIIVNNSCRAPKWGTVKDKSKQIWYILEAETDPDSCIWHQ